MAGLNIPKSDATVDIRAIDSTTTLHMDPSLFFEEKIEGHDDLNGPSFSFLITHGKDTILWDTGVRKDYSNLPPAISKHIGEIAKLHIDKNVADILADDEIVNVKPKDVQAILLSHHHWDHYGNPKLFPKTTALVVGPGFKDKYLPGFPNNPKAPIFEEDFEGRTVRELDIEKEGKGLKIGSLDAMDYFGDGSMYILSTPGHSIGHMSALVRTTPDTFVLLAGDASHHAGEIRPSRYLPLPEIIQPSPLPKQFPDGVPRQALLSVRKGMKVDEGFYHANKEFSSDVEVAHETVRKLQQFDGDEKVLLIIAHDTALRGKIPQFPEKLNDWFGKDVDKKTRWLFLKDFEKAIKS